MSPPAVPAERWLDALVASTLEAAGAALGCPDARLVETRRALPSGGAGAYMPLIADQSLQIALVASEAGCQALAKMLLGMAPTDEDLPSGDVADAVGEIVNVVAGGVKSRMAAAEPGIRLGLPIFIHGHIERTEHIDAVVADVLLGDQPAELLVLQRT